MRSGILFISLILGLSLSAEAQSFDSAKKLYRDGEYEKAELAFKKLVKSSPSSAAYNYWYGLTFMKLNDKANAEKYLNNSAKRRYSESYRALAELYTESYRFEEALEQYDKYIEQLEKAKKAQSAEKYQNKMNEVQRAANMMRGVEKINVIDSVVIDKSDFISAYRLSRETGTLDYYNNFFGTNDEHYGIVYVTQLGNAMIYGDKKADGGMALYRAFKQGESWSKPELLPETVNKGMFQNYPFLLSDGVTIYYASMNEESLGGYDIFATAYNTNTHTYMQPQNIGMPFNSMYNDYMYVIDENNNLGWFASDRFQPENKVCIYVFVPNNEKTTYDYDTTDLAILRKAASLSGFHEVQYDTEMVAEGMESLKNIFSDQKESNKKKQFKFVIDDNRTYTNIYDFMSKPAQEIFIQWQEETAKLEKLKTDLEAAREKYHYSDKATQNAMRNEILDMEKRVETKTAELKEMERNIRNTEINKKL